jgi:hypothetical protein
MLAIKTTDRYGDGFADSADVLSVDGERYVVSLVSKGVSGRRVTGGPLVPGPWADLAPVGHALVGHGSVNPATFDRPVAVGSALSLSGDPEGVYIVTKVGRFASLVRTSADKGGAR